MYLRAYIDQCASYGWTGGQEFQTRIRLLSNGRERRNADWSQGRHRFTIPFQNIGSEGYQAVRQMHEVCRGMLHAFLYLDPLNNEADDELFAVADGSSEYQLTTTSVIDGVSYQREVSALYIPGDNGSAVQVTPIVMVNGTPTAVTVDYDRGKVLFGAPPTPGAVLRWSGRYSVWVRFNNDWLPFSVDNRRGVDFAHNGTIELLELPPPPEPET